MPGQFPGSLLYNLDLRDEDFWYIQAQKKFVRRKMDEISAARFAFSSNESYMDQMTTLKWEMKKLEAWEKGEEG